MLTADVLGERARITPDATALVVVEPGSVDASDDTAPRLTYRELDERARRCALVWRHLGLKPGETGEPGDRAAILAHNRVEYLDAFFAAGKTGSVLVTLGTRLTAHEVAPILEDSGARVVFYDGEFADAIETLRAEHADTVSGVETWVALDEPARPDDRTYSDLCREVEEELADFEPTRCDPEDVYCLIYTSGTTGKPKGVMIPHRQVAWNGYNTACCWGLTAEDVSPIFTPLYHAGGLLAFLGPIFTVGGTIVLHHGFDAGEIWRTIEAEGVTTMLGVPTIWKMLAEAEEFESADLSSIRFLISGGAPLPTWIAEIYQERGVVFRQGFGMTEVGVNCFAMTDDDSVRKLGSIGKPMMHTEVRLVGEGADGQQEEKGADEVGEMWFRGPHVSLGYWNRPDATAEAYGEDGFFRSGDLARRDEDGYFYIAGRAKDMIISGGVNIFPAEIEAVLLQHPGVRDAAVVGIEHPTWGEVGVAFVVPLEEGSAESASVLDFLGERLSRYKLPKEIVHADELPRTAYGKVVKGDLRERYSSLRNSR